MRLASVLLLLGSRLLAAAAPEPQITSFVLENGMKVIVEEDHDIPNVAMYLFYKIGSRNERPGITGISHFFEHMMFNGAKKYGPKQFDVQMEKSGGNNNAYTTQDVTVYTNWFPRTALRLMFDMEADRIQNLAFDPKMIESERGVVFSERQQRIDNSNFGLLDEQIGAAAFTAHPYGWPVIGWASDIQAWTMDDLKDHFRVGYAPNNCVLVLVGDVKTAEVKSLAEEFLQPIPRQEPPPPVRTVEPVQAGERRITIRKAAQLPLQMYAYHVPNARHKDMIAIKLLSEIMTNGRSSRLYKRMVDGDQLALSVSQGPDEGLDPGLLYVSLQPRAGVDPTNAEQVLFEEIEKVRTSEVSSDELQKAKNQSLTAFYREMRTISGRAKLLGSYEVFQGDYKQLFAAQKELEAVTPADVLRVAKAYLGPTNRTAGVLLPEAAK
jgi:zinc protease